MLVRPHTHTDCHPWVMCFCAVWLKKRRNIMTGVCHCVSFYYGYFNKAFTVFTGLYLTEAWCLGRHRFLPEGFISVVICMLPLLCLNFFSLVVILEMHMMNCWMIFCFLVLFNDFSPQTFCLFPYFCIYLSCSALILGKVNSCDII